MAEPIVYLIDGSAYIFRAYHAIRHLSTRDGFPTNAVYGFTQMLFKFIRDYEPEYLGIVFDSKGKTFRHDIYPEYKANRPEPPEDLALQFPVIFEMVEAMGIPMLQMEGYEADDIMGALGRRLEAEGKRVIMITGDKDFCQLVSERVTLYDTMRNTATGVPEVVQKFGVPPERVVDVLALAGDSVDNIPGVRGVGQKTATELVQKWGTVEEIYENLEKLTPKRRKLLEEGHDSALMSKRLVTIDTTIPFEDGLEGLKYGGYDPKRLREEFRKYEFRSLLEEVGEDAEAADYSAGVPEPAAIDYGKYSLVLDEEALDGVIASIKRAGRCAVDLETTSQHAMLADIVGISVCPAPGEAYYIPTGHTSLDAVARGQLPLPLVLERLGPLLEDRDIAKLGQNLKYDLIVLARNGKRLRGIRCDTMLAAHLLDASRLAYGLDSLALDFLGHRNIKYEEVAGKGRNKVTFDQVELDQALPYACEDAEVSLLLADLLMAKLEAEGLMESFQSYEVRLIDVLADMEMAGVRIEPEQLHSLSGVFERELEGITESIYEEAGVEFNINSTQQLREVLFNTLGLPVNKRTKTGEPSTDVEVLTNLSGRHPVPDLVLKYRGLTKLKSTYVDALPRLINPATHRIHTSFNQVGAATGRLSSSDPNLQNIPIKTPEGRRIREAFITDPGFTLLSADYSQIELRLLAHFSGDETLIEAFRNDMDIHSATAQDLFGVEAGSVDADMRRLAKTINFGIIYGISPFGLSKQLGIPIGESKQYIDGYFERYGSVRAYMDRSVEEAAERGYASTLLGRRRPIHELDSKSRPQRDFGERAAINTPIQGSAADIIKVAMIHIHDALGSRGLRSRMVLQVHDELLLEVALEELDEVRELVRELMEGAWELRVPIKVDIGVAANWAQAH